jgi:hypothetical protein
MLRTIRHNTFGCSKFYEYGEVIIVISHLQNLFYSVLCSNVKGKGKYQFVGNIAILTKHIIGTSDGLVHGKIVVSLYEIPQDLVFHYTSFNFNFTALCISQTYIRESGR